MLAEVRVLTSPVAACAAGGRVLVHPQADVLLRDVGALELAVAAVHQHIVEGLVPAGRQRVHAHARDPLLGGGAGRVPAMDDAAVVVAHVADDVANMEGDALRALVPLVLIVAQRHLHCAGRLCHLGRQTLCAGGQRLALQLLDDGERLLRALQVVQRHLRVHEEVLLVGVDRHHDAQNLGEKVVVAHLPEDVHQVGAHAHVHLVALHGLQELRRGWQADRQHQLQCLPAIHEAPTIKAVNVHLVILALPLHLGQQVHGHVHRLQHHAAAHRHGALNDGERDGDASPPQQHLVQQGVGRVVVVVPVAG
mmetsp:Transcript_2546/g.6330  ORF Transcript_2546/g.6330 Transcript_2546/m.6330 type:complete len:308 (-) Transcript_2546:105-1028(-)